MGPCEQKDTYKKIHEMKILEQHQDPNGNNTITWQIVGRELIEENRTPLTKMTHKPRNATQTTEFKGIHDLILNYIS